MMPLSTDSGAAISQAQLSQRDTSIHEYILSKDAHAIDIQLANICRHIPLHPLTIEDCRKGNQRAKLERYPDYVFIVIHHFGAELEQISELHLVLGQKSLLVIADNLPPENHDSWRSFLNLKSELPLSDVFHNIFDCCVDSAERRVAKLADLVSQAESLIVQERFNPKIILSLKQQSLRFQRAAIGAFAVVREFLSGAEVTMDQEILFRNILDHQERLKHELEFFHSDLIALFDVYWGATSFYANEEIKRLTLLATFVVPLGFWSSFFGMNFSVMPFDKPWFFVVALALMLGSVGTVLIYLRRRGLIRNRQVRLNKSLLELFK